MRERVEELKRGDFKNKTPKIEISIPLIEINLNVDDCYDGSFSLRSTNFYKMKGVVYTSTYRMKCKNSQFIGKEATIQFCFQGKGICEGETIKGNFYIISNGGEICLPFVVNIQKSVIFSSMGKINNLFHFTNLAVSNWNEAYKVFQLPQFRNIFINNDKQYESLYLALTSGETISEQCMEEFLIGIHKKNPVSIQINEREKSFYRLTSDEKELITINKSTWGFVRIKVATDCDFIELDRDVIITDNFIGSIFQLEYIIRKNKLHRGKNFGRIVFSTVNYQFSYEIIASTREEEDSSVEKVQAKTVKNCIVALTQLYTSYRCKKTNTNPWVKECMGYVNTLMEIDSENKLYQLLKAQLLFIEKKNYEAYELLKKFEQNKKEMREDVRSYVYYLYLTTFWNKDKKYIHKIVEEVRVIYSKNYNDWEILWVLLFLDSTLQENILQKINLIEKQYARKGDSPILYAEAYRIVKSDPFILTKLGKFEIQVLWWAVKNKVLSHEVILHIANLSAKVKEFNQILFQILTCGYEQFNERETLGAICGLLIKGNKTAIKYFKWYSLGVEQDVRITRLYEYYMYAIPMEHEELIPKPVLMYFGYYNNLDYKKSALLYERVIKQRDVYPELFQNYRRHIEEFMLEQLMLKRNNAKLAFIYDTMLSLNSVTKDIAEAISRILFGCELYCSNKNIKSVSVIHKHLKREKIYPIIDNKAYIHLYTKDYAISFLDYEENRYIVSIDYQLKNLIDEAYYIKKCFELETDNINIQFNICQNLITSNNISDECLKLLHNLIKEPYIKENYKVYLRNIIIQYCYDQYDNDNLTQYITDMDLECIASFQRSKAMEYLIMKGLYDESYEEILKYGYEDIRVKQLVKLVSRLIYLHDYEENEVYLSMAVHVFGYKKYDETILKYLIKYYNGAAGKMRDIWFAAYKFDIDSYELTERLILQVLFTNEYIEEIEDIFEYYYLKGSRFEIAQAFLIYCAHQYLVFDKKLGNKILEYMRKEQENENIQNDACRLATLKYLSEASTVSEGDREFVSRTLQEFIERKMCFKFYENFEEKMLEPYCYEGNYIVEYKSDTESRVTIHYIHEDSAGNGEYKIEEMMQVYPGIYTKKFTMFYGEKLQYYIREENNTENLVKNHIIAKNEMNLYSTQSRYHMLNDMSVASQVNDAQTLLELMNKYVVNSQAVDKLFKIL